MFFFKTFSAMEPSWMNESSLKVQKDVVNITGS